MYSQRTNTIYPAAATKQMRICFCDFLFHIYTLPPAYSHSYIISYNHLCCIANRYPRKAEYLAYDTTRTMFLRKAISQPLRIAKTYIGEIAGSRKTKVSHLLYQHPPKQPPHISKEHTSYIILVYVSYVRCCNWVTTQSLMSKKKLFRFIFLVFFSLVSAENLTLEIVRFLLNA